MSELYRFHALFKEQLAKEGRASEYAIPFIFNDEVQARRAHVASKRFGWANPGWFDLHVSPLYLDRDGVTIELSDGADGGVAQ